MRWVLNNPPKYVIKHSSKYHFIYDAAQYNKAVADNGLIRNNSNTR